MSEQSRVIDQNGCARCNALGHYQVTFYYLTRPIKFRRGRWLTEYGFCPSTKEPILLEWRPRRLRIRVRRWLVGWRP